MNRRTATVGSRSAGAPRPGSRRSQGQQSAAERFAVRVRARRRQRYGWVALAATLLLVLGWLAVLSPWATVHRIQVAGTARVDADAVRLAAAAQRGRPLVLADTAQVTDRVRALRLVRTATVTRRWPSTLLVTVVERTAVAAIPVTGERVRLVDGDGVEVGQAAKPPPGLPVLGLDLGRAGPAALRACLRVLDDLPQALARQVTQVGAQSPDGVWLVLSGGSRVTWGSAEQDAEKAAVLQVLLKQPARSYDVSAPEAPALVARG